MVRLQFDTDFHTMIEVDQGRVFFHQSCDGEDWQIVEFSQNRWEEVCKEVNDAFRLG